MLPKLQRSPNSISRAVVLLFTALWSALLVYFVLDWLRLLPGRPGYRSGALALLSAAMVLLQVASFSGATPQRWRRGLVLLSLAVLGGLAVTR